MPPAIDRPAVRNGLLAAMPADALALLAPHLQPARLAFGEVLVRPGARLEVAWFVEDGVVSMLVQLADGGAQEAGIVGREGLVGLPVVLGGGGGPAETLVQAAGSALRVPAAALREAFEASAGVRAPLLRYVQAFLAQVAQTAVCNGRHPVDERLARWLLTMHDRVACGELAMTQEFLGLMVGARRAGISTAAGVLQRAGAIEYRHGRIRVLDRAVLEAAACECHGVVRAQGDRLLGPPRA